MKFNTNKLEGVIVTPIFEDENYNNGLLEYTKGKKLFKGKLNEIFVNLPYNGEKEILIGLGKRDELKEDQVREVFFKLVKVLAKNKEFEVQVTLPKVKNILAKKRSQGYKSEDLRGKKIILTSSGMLAASHLCGQGAMSNALGNNFKGVWGIPVDGNAVPSLFYHENLSGHDLSVIIGHKDNCEMWCRSCRDDRRGIYRVGYLC